MSKTGHRKSNGIKLTPAGTTNEEVLTLFVTIMELNGDDLKDWETTRAVWRTNSKSKR
jgi:hypothetical protein